jgi:hypothetical protein
MATTGTTAFELDFTDIAEEAWERAGKELRSGYQLRTARRSMNLLLIEWLNRGVNMWTMDETTVALVSGTAEYTLPADTVDLLEGVLRTNSGITATQNDRQLTRISMSRYSSIPNKLTPGPPIQFLIHRQQAAPTVTFWPVPDSNDYILSYWRMRRMYDAGNGVETPDLPFRFLPCLVAGLAYMLAMKDPELRGGVEILKQEYEQQFKMASSEDRERATWRLVPRGVRI